RHFSRSLKGSLSPQPGGLTSFQALCTSLAARIGSGNLAGVALEPYLHMAMRLGEGSGAALAMPIVEAACAMFHNMGELAASNIV
ncbi:nicotinate-nucleotide--dimethylbenzimidazole phosphoribosyltransferase, partial [Salmonella enterica subsp. enterica serovar Montevideo]|nr:nicotinate-nucleotide--dimethylbenzimidazole phosphoribosyltransferase [Salmonella enterica subsp. enterica serovar Montevideo]